MGKNISYVPAIYTVDHYTKVWKTIVTDFKNPVFIILFILMLIIFIWARFIQKNKRLRFAADNAFLAFVIAYFGHLDLIFIAFILVLLYSFLIHSR